MRLLLWTIWGLAAAALGFVVFVFKYFRPTVEYKSGGMADPQSVNVVFWVGVAISVLALGLGLRMLLRNAS
jgi:hypothetical protein